PDRRGDFLHRRGARVNATKNPQHTKTMKEILVANDSGDMLGIDNGNPSPGIVCMANTSRFVEAFFSEPLTTYATGWRDTDGLQDLLDFIAPPTETPRR